MDRHIQRYLRIVATFSFLVTFIVALIIYFVDYSQSEYKVLANLNFVIQKNIESEENKLEYIKNFDKEFNRIRIRYISGSENYDSKGEKTFL